MAIVRPFKGIRPVVNKVEQVAARPYDVLNKNEARVEAAGNPYSLYHVTKPEIDLSDKTDPYDPIIYVKGKEYFDKLKNEKVFIQDTEKYFYIYAQTMDGRTQYGLVACSSIEDYQNNIIKKHEYTLPAKEDERTNHIRVSGLNYEPVFFAYRDVKEINEIVGQIVKTQPAEYDFTTVDGFGHHFWVIKDQKTIDRIVELFDQVPYTYIADGHHRTAAAARAGIERKQNNPNHNGEEEYNFFLTVLFPSSHLKILDYNRLIKDLNDLTPEEVINKLEHIFLVEEKGSEIYKPEFCHNFSMYMDGKWYSLTAKKTVCNESNPIDCLDTSIFALMIAKDIFGIDDQRKSKRIDFVGGIRGLGELKKRVDSGEMAVAFAFYPVSMEQLFKVADTNNIMPPKVTWFEPKLRSGLVLHNLND